MLQDVFLACQDSRALKSIIQVLGVQVAMIDVQPFDRQKLMGAPWSNAANMRASCATEVPRT